MTPPKTRDTQIKIITAKMPDEFTAKVQTLLDEGKWRITNTEMSVTDHSYWAMLVKGENE